MKEPIRNVQKVLLLKSNSARIQLKKLKKLTKLRKIRKLRESYAQECVAKLRTPRSLTKQGGKILRELPKDCTT